MKQKSDSTPTTQENLDSQIKDINKSIEILEKSLRVEIKLSTLSLEQRIVDKITKSQNLLLTTFDPLLRELEERREERSLSSHQTEELRKEIEILEKRVHNLEKVQTAS